MHKKIRALFFLFALIGSYSCFSMSGIWSFLMSTSYDFPTGQLLTLVNTSSQTTTAICQMTVTSNQNHSILVKVLSGYGQINGTTLSKGQTLVQTVYNTQVIPLTASAGAKAEFINLGPYKVNASCS